MYTHKHVHTGACMQMQKHTVRTQTCTQVHPDKHTVHAHTQAHVAHTGAHSAPMHTSAHTHLVTRYTHTHMHMHRIPASPSPQSANHQWFTLTNPAFSNLTAPQHPSPGGTLGSSEPLGVSPSLMHGLLPPWPAPLPSSCQTPIGCSAPSFSSRHIR